jgi:predicted membrane channel-forming protein YqfA (hemolysin III family)
MPPMIVWFDLVIGAVVMIVARLTWLRGKKEGSRARRWQSVMYIALSLCALFSVGQILAAPPGAVIWFALMVGAVLLLWGSAFVAELGFERERRGNNAATVEGD